MKNPQSHTKTRVSEKPKRDVVSSTRARSTSTAKGRRSRGDQKTLVQPESQIENDVRRGPPVSSVKNVPAQEQFDRARMQWFFGDWENLIRLDDDHLATTPNRENLALLIGCAYQQLGDSSNARRLVRQALDWGCDRHSMFRLLVAGVYNTLARSAALANEENKALAYFREAVSGLAGDHRLACQARSVREVARLGLFQQASQYIEKQSDLLLQTDSDDESEINDEDSPELMLLHQINCFQKRNGLTVTRNAPAGALTGGRSAISLQTRKNAIVIAGMRHSGSTVLFNVVKIALEMKKMKFASFYSEGKNKEALISPADPLLLVKTHEFRDDVAARAAVVITARRDLRDSVASAVRRNFHLLRGVGSPIEYAKFNRSLHAMWLPYSSYEFVYEHFLDDPEAEISRVLRQLCLEGLDVSEICRQVHDLPTDQYDTTLLSPQHITDPERVLSFRSTLESDVIDAITMNNHDWLGRYGYLDNEPV